ncbi:MAG TPA: protein kinase, partial [Pseudonocardiaceae bacterium]
MAGDPLSPTDPRSIGDYTLLARLGAGGMGRVYLARDRAGAQVAVKVLHDSLAGDPRFLARFADEAAAAARVAGFCTARVVRASVSGPRPFLVTEYVEGPTLAAVLAARGRLPGSEAEALAVGVAAALTAIHAAGIVHRDLKPSNVMLSAFGPKVIDFGVARALDARAAATEVGHVLGTPGWMAPEHLLGHTSPAGDVYVWGLLMAHAGGGWQSGGA